MSRKKKTNLNLGVLDALQQPNGMRLDPRLVLLGILLWAMLGMSILSFVVPDASLKNQMLRGLGWWLTITFTPTALLGALELRDIKDEPEDLFKNLN